MGAHAARASREELFGVAVACHSRFPTRLPLARAPGAPSSWRGPSLEPARLPRSPSLGRSPGPEAPKSGRPLPRPPSRVPAPSPLGFATCSRDVPRPESLRSWNEEEQGTRGVEEGIRSLGVDFLPMVQSDTSKSPPVAAVAQESQMELLESAAPAGALGAQVGTAPRLLLAL